MYDKQVRILCFDWWLVFSVLYNAIVVFACRIRCFAAAFFFFHFIFFFVFRQMCVHRLIPRAHRIIVNNSVVIVVDEKCFSFASLSKCVHAKHFMLRFATSYKRSIFML